MEATEVENAQNCPIDGAQLARNRSFKTKQLVRSQAIRESQSPPRSLTPAAASAISREAEGTTTSQLENKDKNVGGASAVKKMHSVEIQITTGCDSDPAYGPGNGQRERAARWLGHGCHLLSHPLVTCVCRCHGCSGIRREYRCPTKQDSGIACSEDCPDCPECDHTGGAGDGIVKSASDDLVLSDANNYCKCPERKDKPKNILLKSDSVEERLELTGPELIEFIKETLNKSSKDRVALLKIEKELHALVNDTGRSLVRFPVMSSYGRMLVHRCASLFQLSHNLDSYNKACVLVSKNGTSGGRIPCTTFKQWCTVTFSPNHSQESIQAKSILKRLGSGSQEGSAVPTAARSLAQRQRDYDTLRTRIFNSVQSLEGASEPVGRERVVSKSHSFAGYPPESQQRQLSRQGDLASSSWRLSPSSSGYKTLSLRSTDSITPSPTGGVSPEPSPVPLNPVPTPALSELAPAPHTQLLLHPQNGHPLLNPDGSFYQYDPNNPPVLYEEPSDLSDQQHIDQNNEKRRGRLEKQHSFIETEYETAPQETPEHSYQRSLSCTAYLHDQVQTHSDHMQNPTMQNYDVTATPTNHIVAVQDLSANHAPSYDSLGLNRPQSIDTNQRQDKLSVDPMQYSTPIGYVHSYRPEGEVDSPNQHLQLNYAQSNIHGAAKTIPLQAIQDPNLRALPLQGVVYPTHIPQGYVYPNNCRMEGGAYATSIYQPVATSIEEQQKQMAQSDNTFRIDASYPYATVDAYACGTQCVSGCTLDPSQHRTVYAAQPVDSQGAVFPLTNIMIPQQYPLTQYQPLQWQTNVQPLLTPITSTCTTPLQKPITPPNIYIPSTDIPIYPPHLYQQGQIYPLMYQLPYIPQTYPVCQNIYPVEQRNEPKDTKKFNSARNTPQTEIETKNQSYDKEIKTQFQTNPEKVEIKDGVSNDLAIQIQKINERFSTLSTDDKVESPRNFRGERYDHYKKKNNGNGILGCYPANSGFNRNFGRPTNEDVQLQTAARAIVNSIRHIQSKSHYQPDTYRRAQEQANRTEGQPQQTQQAYQPYNHQKHENYQKPESYPKPEICQKTYQKLETYQKNESYQKQENKHTPEKKSESFQKPDNNQTQESYRKPENYQKPENFQRQDSYQNGRFRYQRQYEPERKVEETRFSDAERSYVQRDRNFGSGRFENTRNRTGNPMMPFPFRQPYIFRQMTPNTWCRRTPPSPFNPAFGTARRPPPDARNPRR